MGKLFNEEYSESLFDFTACYCCSIVIQHVSPYTKVQKQMTEAMSKTFVSFSFRVRFPDQSNENVPFPFLGQACGKSGLTVPYGKIKDNNIKLHLENPGIAFKHPSNYGIKTLKKCLKNGIKLFSRWKRTTKH